MDLCPGTSAANKKDKMTHDEYFSSSELHSFTFGSLQTSLMTSCVSAFKCGPLPGNCGSRSHRFSKRESLSKPLDGTQVTAGCNLSTTKGLVVGEKLHLQMSNAETSLLTENQEHLKTPMDASFSVTSSNQLPDADIVITQPTLGKMASSCNFSSLNDSGNHSPIQSCSVKHLNKHSDSSHGEENLTTSVNMQFQKSSHSPKETSEDVMASFNPLQARLTLFTRVKPAHENALNKHCDSELSPQSSRLYPSDVSATENKNRCSHLKHSQSLPSPVVEKRHSTVRSDSEPPICSVSETIETQKLFTPEDLCKEQLQPNPHGIKSVVYQNFNAKEADFVLQRPKRKPKKALLPSVTLVTVGQTSDSSKLKEGIIEPLATEDEVALQEGSKEFMENGLLQITTDTSQKSPDFKPCEAVNFALETSIDNFDREEYVEFRKTSNVDVEMPNIADSHLLQLLISRSKNKRMQMNRSDRKCEVNGSLHRMDYGNTRAALRNSSNLVSKSSSESHYNRKHSRNRTNFSRKRDAPCQSIQRSANRQPEKSLVFNIRDSTAVEDSIVARIATADTCLKEVTSDTQSKTKPLPCSQSIESSPKRANSNSLRFRRRDDSIFPFFCSFDECVTRPGDAKPMSKSKSFDSHKMSLNLKPNAGERYRHKKSTKFSKNFKYHRIHDHDQTSVDDGAEPSINMNSGVPSCPNNLVHHSSYSSKVHLTKEPNPLLTYGDKVTPKTTMDILEEVQSNLRARLACLEDLDAVADNIAGSDGNILQGKPLGKSLSPLRVLGDKVTPTKPSSGTPPSSSSPSSPKDDCVLLGTTRKEKTRKHNRKKNKRGRRERDDSVNTARALYKRPSPSWSTTTSASSSDESSVSLSSPKSSPVTSSTSGSTSSSTDSTTSSSSSSIESSDVEESLV